MRTPSTAVLVLLTAALVAQADTTSTEGKLQKLQTAVQDITNKAGISLGGEFNSEYFWSRLGGPSRNHASRSTESNEYTSVDFDITARPTSAIQGRLIFRMHQNWQNFFSDISNPIFSRWISIDGSVKDVFSYHAGDLRARYSPYMLYSPDVEILYEPQLFSLYRTRAAGERFLGNNDRILQGLTVNFDAEVAPIFDEAHVGVIGTRLRSIETSIKNGSMVANLMEAAAIEKYLTGANADLLFLKGVSAGGTYLKIFDNPYSYRGTDSTADTLAQNTSIVGGRIGLDVAKLLGSSSWDLALNLDLGHSSDDSAWYKDTSRTQMDPDTANDPDTIRYKVGGDTAITGLAFTVGLGGGITLDFLSAHASIGFVSNSPWYRNELAQSPSCVGQRIMNTENDAGNPVPVYDVNSYHYSTFDAVYGNVFKFAPSDRTNLWEKAPLQKNAYTNAIFTQKELDLLKSRMDPSLQLVMPFGPATPNRQGIKGDVTIGALNKGLEVKGLFASLTEIEGRMDLAQTTTTHDTVTLNTTTGVRDTVPTTHDTLKAAEFPATAFMQYGAGLRFDVASVAKIFPYPLVVSGSLVHAQAVNAGPDQYPVNDWTITSDFINAGVYCKFWKRTALMLGFQQITNTSAWGDGPKYTQVQQHYGIGMEYRIADGAFLSGSVGDIVVRNTDDSANSSAVAKRDFEQLQVGLLLSVKF